MWNDSPRKHTGDWQKNSIQTKLQERSPRNQVGKKKKDIRMGPNPLGGIYKRERLCMGRLWPRGAPLPVGRSSGTDRGAGVYAGLLTVSVKTDWC